MFTFKSISALIAHELEASEIQNLDLTIEDTDNMPIDDFSMILQWKLDSSFKVMIDLNVSRNKIHIVAEVRIFPLHNCMLWSTVFFYFINAFHCCHICRVCETIWQSRTVITSSMNTTFWSACHQNHVENWSAALLISWTLNTMETLQLKISQRCVMQQSVCSTVLRCRRALLVELWALFVYLFHFVIFHTDLVVNIRIYSTTFRKKAASCSMHWTIQRRRNVRQQNHWSKQRKCSQTKRKMKFWSSWSDVFCQKIEKQWSKNWKRQHHFVKTWFWMISKRIAIAGSFISFHQIW